MQRRCPVGGADAYGSTTRVKNLLCLMVNAEMQAQLQRQQAELMAQTNRQQNCTYGGQTIGGITGG